MIQDTTFLNSTFQNNNNFSALSLVLGRSNQINPNMENVIQDNEESNSTHLAESAAFPTMAGDNIDRIDAAFENETVSQGGEGDTLDIGSPRINDFENEDNTFYMETFRENDTDGANMEVSQNYPLKSVLGTLFEEMVGQISPQLKDKAVDEALQVLQRFVNQSRQAGEDARNTEIATHDYLKLLELDTAGYVPNTFEFECSICMSHQKEGQGVVLKDCLHQFCRPCIVQLVEGSQDVTIKCPHIEDSYSCGSFIAQTEIKAIVPHIVFEKYINLSLSLAEHQCADSFHCRTPNCTGWCIIEPGFDIFFCPVCNINNCLKCKALHPDISCEAFKQLENVDGVETLNALGTQIDRGLAMPCPKCKVLVEKSAGCDYMTCLMCKTEICWVTRGPRWGPAGKGDTSGGCRCRVNNKLCHPNCQNCH